MISFTSTWKTFSTCYCVDYSDFTKFNKHAPKKIKTFQGNQKPHINKILRKAIMKRSQLKNKANKTRNTADCSNSKKQRNYVVKLSNHCKKDYFDTLNPEKGSNHSENINILLENQKLH